MPVSPNEVSRGHQTVPVPSCRLFSPPRFSLEVEKHGGKGLAFDIKQGWDLLNPKTQEQVDRLLDKARPELLVVCPTCTHSEGWENLNQ